MNKLTPAKAKKIRDWLKAHGHSPSKVNPINLKTSDDLRTAVCELHGVREDEYHRAMKT